MPSDRPDSFQGKDGASRRYVPSAAFAVFQENADRARLRREAERAGLHGVFRQANRRLAEELYVVRSDHALGRRGRGAKVRRLHSVMRIGLDASASGGETR